MTNLLNFTQYKSPNGLPPSAVPSPLPFPWMLSAQDSGAPAFTATCQSRSPDEPYGCTGVCTSSGIFWNQSWVYFAGECAKL